MPPRKVNSDPNHPRSEFDPPAPEDQAFDAWWKTTPIPEPSEEQWQSVLEQVEKHTQPRRSALPPWRRALVRWAAALSTSAALLLVSWQLVRISQEAGPTPGPAAQVDTDPEEIPIDLGEELVVLTNVEVEIHSMDGQDADDLIVGEPPLPASLELAKGDELSIDRVEPYAEDGELPDFYLSEQGLPMLTGPGSSFFSGKD